MHRGRVDVGHATGRESIALTGKAAGLGITVGDWVVLEPAEPVVRRRLDRQSLFQRRAAGTAGELQLIAANVDTLFIVTSANRDFNVARLERYLAIVGGDVHVGDGSIQRRATVLIADDKIEATVRAATWFPDYVPVRLKD